MNKSDYDPEEVALAEFAAGILITIVLGVALFTGNNVIGVTAILSLALIACVRSYTRVQR